MNKNILYIVLVILLIIVYIKPIYKPNIINTNTNDQKNDIIIVEPKPIVVEREFYSDIDEAQIAADRHNKKLLIIFTADWCPYCKTLKKDLQDKTIINNQYIICIVDIDKNKLLLDKYKIKTLPTSIIMEHLKEISRKNGYRKDVYIEWLDKP